MSPPLPSMHAPAQRHARTLRFWNFESPHRMSCTRVGAPPAAAPPAPSHRQGRRQGTPLVSRCRVERAERTAGAFRHSLSKLAARSSSTSQQPCRTVRSAAPPLPHPFTVCQLRGGGEEACAVLTHHRALAVLRSRWTVGGEGLTAATAGSSLPLRLARRSWPAGSAHHPRRRAPKSTPLSQAGAHLDVFQGNVVALRRCRQRGAALACTGGAAREPRCTAQTSTCARACEHQSSSGTSTRPASPSAQ